MTVAALFALAGCGGEAHMFIDGAQYSEPGRLAESSEYLVRATLTGQLEPYDIADDDVMRYWVGAARIEEVIAQRPDVAARLAPGMTVSIGTPLLNLAESHRVANASELANDTDQPRAGDTIVAFLVHSDLGTHGPGYGAVGQGVLSPDGRVTMRALPGPLNHDVLTLAEVTSKLRGRYAEPAPWRSRA